MKKFEYDVSEVKPDLLKVHLDDMGNNGWEYCQILVNQHIEVQKVNAFVQQPKIDIKYLVILNREVI